MFRLKTVLTLCSPLLYAIEMKYLPSPIENKLQNREITQDGAVCAKQSAHYLLREHAETLANLLSDADISIVILRGVYGC